MHNHKFHVCLLTSGRIFELSYGGEEKFTISLGNWLFKNGVDVTLMGSTFFGVKSKRLTNPDDGKNDRENFNNQKGKAFYFPYPIYFLSRLILSLFWFIDLIVSHKKFKFTLIHAQDTGYSGLSAVIAGKILRIPVVISSHGIRHESLKSIIQGKFKKILLKMEYAIDIFTVKNCSKVITVNPYIKNYYEEITKKKVDFLPIPIKVNEFEYSAEKRNLTREELGISESSKLVCFIGRLSAEKNVKMLINSFINILQFDRSLFLAIIGGGVLESDLKNYVKEKGIENKIIFCGIRYDIDKFLSSCDIFVLPSFVEGMSTVLLEAMACTRAIICSDISANRNILSEKDAIFINPHKINDLELAILSLSRDDLLRKKLGENAKIKVMQYDEDIIFPKLLTIYKSELKNAK